MIHIARDRVDEAGKPIRPSDHWFRMSGEARDIAEREGKAHSPKESIYAHLQVRLALEKLFHGKCAYCESAIGAVASWDVDHFRPKGRVAERPDHPGYFWLTYEWTNLYPACTLCNQRRHDPPHWDDPAVGVGGKRDLFPLADEGHRAMAAGADLALESRLLLDPCDDEPQFSLTFDALGHPVGLDPRGEASIEVFHLQRKRLRDLRRRVIEKAIKVVAELRRLAPADPGRPRAEADLEELTREESLYAAAARAVRDNPAAFGID